MFNIIFDEYWYRYKNPQTENESGTSFWLVKNYFMVDVNSHEIYFDEFEENDDSATEGREAFLKFSKSEKNEKWLRLDCKI